MRCTLCGRALRDGGIDVPGLGILGPDCATHAAALQLHLIKHDLAGLMTETGIQISGTLSADRTLPSCANEMRALRLKAERAGLTLRCTWQPGLAGAITFTYHAKPGQLLHKLALRVSRKAA
ncbi:hypothetical protein [Deinococcus peraridilitoris]|uniref:hypothetical protein n=1 Tax=Deinococcus peraridilitoris TaxID=432329 RepID=UPI0002FCEB3D|nr:hypothetical protein [Deinococcus peraridilitoris]